jgi:hypothetical protein
LGQLIKRNTRDSLTIHHLIEWKPFLEAMALIESAKRDSIPEKTLETWYNIFRNLGWTHQQVKDKVWSILKKKSYGNATVRIDDFFEDENTFTESEMKLELQKRINSIIKQAIDILNWQGKQTDLRSYFCDFFHIDDACLKLAVADMVLKTYELERRREIDFIIEEDYNQQIEAIRTRRKIISGFKLQKRKKLIKLLHQKGIITIKEKGTDAEKEIFIKNIGIFAGDLTDEEVERI